MTTDLAGEVSAVDLVRAGSEAVGGKGGGGRPDMAQAGGPDGSQPMLHCRRSRHGSTRPELSAGRALIAPHCRDVSAIDRLSASRGPAASMRSAGKAMTAEGTDFTIYREAMILLATAAVLVPIGQRFKLSPILGFLIAGAVLGPHGLGALTDYVPALSWITVSEDKGLGAIAELGVVFLLFIIGLELSFTRLLTMRRLVFGLGTMQVAISAVIIGLIAALLGAGAGAAMIIGFSLALSSTAVVVEVLSRRHRFNTGTGRMSFAILLLQDLAVVPLLFLVTILEPGREGSLLGGLLQAFAQAVLVIGVIALVGSTLLRPLFRLVASADSTELFVAAACSSPSARASSPPPPACRWRSAPSSPGCCWLRPSTTAPSRRPSSPSRGCCSACSSSPSG